MSTVETRERERAIQEVKVKRKLPYFDAKQVILGYSTPTAPLYSSVMSTKRPMTEVGVQTKATMSSVGTQTDPVEIYCLPNKTAPQGGEINRSTSTSTKSNIPRPNDNWASERSQDLPAHKGMSKGEEENNKTPNKEKKNKNKKAKNNIERERSPVLPPNS